MSRHSFFGQSIHLPIPHFLIVAFFAMVWTNLSFCDEIGDILHAAEVGDLTKVQALLKDRPDLVFSKDNFGHTPLHEAARMGHKDVAQLLLANKADVNAQDSAGFTPLHWAAATGKLDVAQLLLANGAKVEARDENGMTPLHQAAERGHRDMAELLIANKAEVNAKDNFGRTPGDFATIGGHRDVVQLLRKQGEPESARGASGSDTTPAKETGGDRRFIAYDNGTVLDTATHLMWAAKDNGTALGWPDAKSFSESYRGGGFTDWRLPTLDELKGLYDSNKTYKSNCDSQLDHGVVVDDVHLTEFIHLTCIREWTSEGRSGYPGSVIMFDFHYGNDILRPGFQGFIDAAGRVLPVRVAEAAKPQQQVGAPKTGSIAYSRVVIRNGALVLKDVHDSYGGDGWIAGTVVSSSAKAFVVSVSGTVLAGSAVAKNKEYTVAIDEKTSVCVAQKSVAASLTAVSGLQPGQRVSVAFRKGTHTADRIVDQSYEIVTRMATPVSASPTGPSMPQCD